MNKSEVEVMKRTPIIFSRKAIFHRTAIFRRIALCTQNVSYENCRLCTQVSDCQGQEYLWACDEYYEKKDVYRVLYVSSLDCDWVAIEAQIWNLENKGLLLRLIIDRDIPDRVLWAASYSAKNIFQVNINMIDLEKNLSWIQRLVSLAGNCGLYSVLFLYPIIPGLVKSYDVLEVIDNFRNAGYHHITLKFGEITNCDEVDGYLNFGGTPVSTRYLTQTSQGTWECTKEYLKLFTEKIQVYTIPRKVSISVCGCGDCTGLGENNVTKS